MFFKEESLMHRYLFLIIKLKNLNVPYSIAVRLTAAAKPRFQVLVLNLKY